MKGCETFPPARNGSRNCRRDHTILKLPAIMLQVSGSNKGKVPTHNPPTNTPDLDDDEDVALLKRQILELKSALNKQANYI
jgi:hypothetical protein